jgi:glutamate dehydrogenase
MEGQKACRLRHNDGLESTGQQATDRRDPHMPSPARDQKQSLLDPLLRLAAARQEGAQAALAQAFIVPYFEQADGDDLATRSAEDLYGAAMSHLAFARDFSTGLPKIRVYNPRVEEHGWASAHTVIEIVNDDMPFLVDSVTMEVNRQGHTVHLLLHPLFRTLRDQEGRLQSFGDAEGARQESLIHVEVDRETDPKRLKALGDGILAVLSDVRASVEDWNAMRSRMQEAVAELSRAPKGLAADEVAEIRAFLEWIANDHFSYLGYREYDLKAEGGEDQLYIVPRTGLGVLREPKLGGLSTSFRELPRELRALAREPQLLVLNKSYTRATVHRPGYLDYIGIRKFDAAGRVVGEKRFVGLYTSSAYHQDPRDIPLLRRKVARVIERTGFQAASHLGKSLLSVIVNYPRDELFQVDEADLFATATGVLKLGDRRRTRVFIRRDIYGRFYSCLVYVPRENFNTDVRLKIEEILKRHLAGVSVEFTVQLSEAVLARLHLLVRTSPRDNPAYDIRAIEGDIAQAIRRWDDDLRLALTERFGEQGAADALRAYANAFPVAYRETLGARSAVRDIATMQELGPARPRAFSLYRPVEADQQTLRLRLFKLGGGMPLSSSLPILENMGLTVQDEQSWAIAREGGEAVTIHDFGMRSATPVTDLEAVKVLFETALERVVAGVDENDGFNRLVLRAGISADEVVGIRAAAKYMKQAGFTFSPAYIQQTLAAHPGIVAGLVALFHARFDPAREAGRGAACAALVARIEGALDAVANLDEDRILRRFLKVIEATVRTNAYQRDAKGARKPYLSFKLDSAKVPELPDPRPLFEVFVYSPRFEAIHLRGGKVARGGLRWSDRPEDFRTEVLGLMKAQMVKNAVIVPVGSKGGFVLKAAPPPSDREAYLKEGIACYQDFLRGILDLTDNLVGGAIVAPRDVVRHDADDPYLVVAADKGTATFSDYANAVSAEYGHWLGDAFASGGSVGYDHKKMGITARGAWESVKRHFREMGVDTQSQDFTVVGIGDMSGDVFGNGMLLSRHIRLLAAFDHRHIFLDPDPDPEASFRERERLFALPRSSWADYDATLVSKGGGVHARTLKSIALTPEVRKALDVAEESLTPLELIRAILKAPVDLLYNGGIGTYVKATHQSHAEVGDRATDAVRVNGAELRCKVVAEGGNLGLTQLGRIEYAAHGGHLYTDAIDNSAGVDCSDHEVNIKILVGLVTAEGELTGKQRGKLLAQMTDEVGLLVLADNYFQTQSLAVSGVRGEKLLDAQASYIRSLERAGRLNRAVEFLPAEEEIAERRQRKAGLTAPERAVLLAYSKMELFDELLKSTIIDDPYVAAGLPAYFPTLLRERHAGVMPRHPLRREILATMAANAMINRTGSVFVHRMREETGASHEDVVRSFLLVRDIFGLEALWAEIDALDGKVSAALQYGMLIDAGRLVLRATLWFLRRRRERLPMAEVIAIFRPGVQAVAAMFPEALADVDRAAWNAAVARLTQAGVPEALARRLAGLEALYATLDVTEVAEERALPRETVAAIYFALTGKLELRWIAERISALPTETTWQALARNALRDDLASQQRGLATAVARLAPEAQDVGTMLAAWESRAQQPLARLKAMVAELKRAGSLDLAVLSVLLRELRGLA